MRQRESGASPLLRKLGEGGMGVVYLGYMTIASIDGRRSIKVLHHEIAGSERLSLAKLRPWRSSLSQRGARLRKSA